jgi:hypothetical protein
MAKFAPALVAPALLVGRGPFRIKRVLVAAAVFTAVCAALIVWFLPAGGLKEMWDTTLGFQLHRTSPLSLWTRHPSLDFLRPLFAVSTVALAIVAAFVPRRRTVGQVAALCAAILAATQIPTRFWLYFYVVWFAPLLFVALFEEYRELGPRLEESRQRDELLREPRQDLAAVAGDGNEVLDANPQLAR